MPSVAMCVCKDCGCTDELVLVSQDMLNSMPPCKCGGQMQVTRVFYDRPMSDLPESHVRGEGDGCFDPDEERPADSS